MYRYKSVVPPGHINRHRSLCVLHAAEKEPSPSASDYLPEPVNQKFTNRSFAYLVAISETEFEALKKTMLKIAWGRRFRQFPSGI